MMRRSINHINQLQESDDRVVEGYWRDQGVDPLVLQILLDCIDGRGWSILGLLGCMSHFRWGEWGLTCLVSSKEMQGAHWSLGKDKTPGLDGFPLLFFYHYWSIIGGEVGEAVQGIFESKGLLEEWKNTLITLILKRPDASVLSHFKPISLCTILYKVYTKILVG